MTPRIGPSLPLAHRPSSSLQPSLLLVLCLIASTSSLGCAALGRVLFPSLPQSGASNDSRAELRVIGRAEINERNRSIDHLLATVEIAPKTISDLAEKFSPDREGGEEPSEADRARLQKAYGQLASVNKLLHDADGGALEFRARDQAEDHPAYARARERFYACTGLLNPYEVIPQLAAFEPSASAYEPTALSSTGALRHEGYRRAWYSALATTNLYKGAAKPGARSRQHARLLEVRRSHVVNGEQVLALRLIYRLAFAEKQGAFQIEPVYLWMDESYVKVAGLSRGRPWGWLWPWMWLHDLSAMANPHLRSVDLDTQLTLQSIITTEKNRSLQQIGAVRFAFGSLDVREFPIERSCAAGKSKAPSPLLPLPRGAGVVRAPTNFYVEVSESLAVGHGHRHRGRTGRAGERDSRVLEVPGLVADASSAAAQSSQKTRANTK